VSRGVLCEFIAAEKTTYGVRRLCRVFGISPTSFYAWVTRAGGPTAAELEEAYAIEAARTAWVEHRRVYGARRLTAEVRDRGKTWNRKRVARLMRAGGIEGIHRRRRGKYGRRSASTATAPDLVERDFTATAPDQLWVADISYLRTWEGFAYLAIVVDAFSRRVVGWAMADHLRTELVLDAVGMAITTRKPAAGTVHHTDRGSQYTAIRYQNRLTDAGAVASIGSVGDSYDNAAAESLIGLYKTECTRRDGPWRSVDDLELATLSWVHWFNTTRLHSALGHKPPIEVEQEYYRSITVEQQPLLA
jgi:putative transposase